MMTTNTTTSRAPATPHPLRWRVTQGGPHGLIPGDVVTWNPSAPKGERVTVERVPRLHEGDIDRLQLRGTLVPLDATILASRQALVLQLLRDRDLADHQAAA